MKTKLERVNELRVGVGLLDAKKMIEHQMLLEQIEAATTIADVKAVLRVMAAR